MNRAEVRLTVASLADLRRAQELVARRHYLHRPVDARCSPLAYVIATDAVPWAGVLIFGRPQATRCNGWYGSPGDVAQGACRLSRWQVINLARIWLDPAVQRGGAHYVPNLATRVIAQALRAVVVDYLLHHPPCFLEEPWMLVDVLSYCDSRVHSGALYRAANFRLVRMTGQGMQTFSRPLRRLEHAECRLVERAAASSARSRRYRSMRAARCEQTALWPTAPEEASWAGT